MNDLPTTARPTKSGWRRSKPVSRTAMRTPRPARQEFTARTAWTPHVACDSSKAAAGVIAGSSVLAPAASPSVNDRVAVATRYSGESPVGSSPGPCGTSIARTTRSGSIATIAELPSSATVASRSVSGGASTTPRRVARRRPTPPWGRRRPTSAPRRRTARWPPAAPWRPSSRRPPRTARGSARWSRRRPPRSACPARSSP